MPHPEEIELPRKINTILSRSAFTNGWVTNIALAPKAVILALVGGYDPHTYPARLDEYLTVVADQIFQSPKAANSLRLGVQHYKPQPKTYLKRFDKDGKAPYYQ